MVTSRRRDHVDSGVHDGSKSTRAPSSDGRASTAECPPDAVFVDLLEDRLPAPEAARLLRHAEGCDACRALLELTAGEDEARPSRPPVTAPGHDDAARRIGDLVGGRYRLAQVLGEGGMGSVFEAEETTTGERFALKLIHGRLLLSGRGARSRFRREARAASAVASPHIIRVVDSGEDEVTGDLFLVMERLSGEDLQQLVDREGPLRPDAALRIAAQALLGLERAHEAGIVHRDIKPANLFLARGDGGEVTVKILDFGVAKIVADPAKLPHTTGLTHTGGLVGSPLYMSPEQAQGSKAVDHRTDLWSLGSLLYCALCGRAPHAGAGSVGKLILDICSSPARPIREVAPWIAPAVADVVHRALAIDAARRYPSAAAMRAALEPLVPGGLAIRAEMLAGVSEEERAAAPIVPAPRAATEVTTTSATAEAPRPERHGTRAASARLGAGAALVLGLAVTARAALVHAPRAAPVEARKDAATVAPVVSPPPVAPETIHRVQLTVLPADASVEVDGALAAVQNGAVEIAGVLGSTHRVRVSKGKAEAATEVIVTDKGAAPSRVELAPPPPVRVPPRPRPAAPAPPPPDIMREPE
jgi:serine/threonine-protein kinase